MDRLERIQIVVQVPGRQRNECPKTYTSCPKNGLPTARSASQLVPMEPGGRATRAFTAYGEPWTVTRHPPPDPRTNSPEVGPTELQPGELVFESDEGERRRLSVPGEKSFPTQEEFHSLRHSDLTRLLERAAPE